MRTMSRASAIGALVAIVLIGGTFLGGKPAAARVDLTGTWTAEYSLACSATFTQDGMAVHAVLDCGSDIVIGLDGTFDEMSRSLMLTGDFTGFPVNVSASVSDDGALMSGTWTAPPLVDGGPFHGAREGAPLDASEVTGTWNFNVQNIFSGSCTADIEQDGVELTADVECDSGPSGQFTGTIDPKTNHSSLEGPFGNFNVLHMDMSLSKDEESFNGIWVIIPGGPAGTLSGDRVSGPAGDRTPTRSRVSTTPLPTVLPVTGSGSPAGGSPAWPYAAVVAALALSAASYVALRRSR